MKENLKVYKGKKEHIYINEINKKTYNKYLE